MFKSALFVIIAVAVAGCSGATPVSPEPAPGTPDAGSSSSSGSTNAEIELRYDEKVQYENLELEWLKLEDSRCPIGVTCIWAGQIVVTVEVTRGEEAPIELELLLRIGDEPRTARAFDYELRLLGVDPHPKQGKTPTRADFVATIEITAP